MLKVNIFMLFCISLWLYIKKRHFCSIFLSILCLVLEIQQLTSKT